MYYAPEQLNQDSQGRGMQAFIVFLTLQVILMCSLSRELLF